MVNLGYSVQRLMDVSNIVNNHSQREWSLILKLGQLLGNLPDITWVFDRYFTSQESSEISQSINNVEFTLIEVEIVNCCAWLIQVRLINKVPRWLEFSKSSLDFICKGGTLSHGMVSFGYNHVRVIGWERVELIQDFLDEGGAIFIVKDLFSSSGDEHVTLSVESRSCSLKHCQYNSDLKFHS